MPISKLMFQPPAWMAEGRCAEVDPALFFAEHRGDRHATVAKTICANCEVRDKCLDYAMGVQPDFDYGVWGGTTETERKRLRAQSRGINVIDLTDEEIDMTFDLRDYIEDEITPAPLLPVVSHDFDVDEAALERALEEEIERELRAA